MSRTAARLAVLGATLAIVVTLAVLNHQRMTGRRAAAPATDLSARPAPLPDGAVQVTVGEDGTATIHAEPTPDRKALVSSLFQGALVGARDHTDFDQTPGYVRLLDGVRDMPSADFASRIEGHLDWADAVAHPEQWRGRFVSVRGLVADDVIAKKIFGANRGLDDIYRVFIGQPDGTEFVALDCVEPPPPLLTNKDVVDVDGIFYRTARYENKDGEMKEAPWLIVRKLSVYTPPAPDRSLVALGWKLAAVLAASITAAVLLLRWSSRRRRPHSRLPAPGTSIRDMFESRLREERRSPPKRTENDKRT